MGLFDKQKPVQEDTQQAAWLADRARIASFLYRARTFNGTGSEDPTLTIALRNGERALLVATGTYLVDRVASRRTGQACQAASRSTCRFKRCKERDSR